METSHCPKNRHGSRGFSVAEILVAMLVLTVGLLSLAGLAALMVSGTSHSHFASLAADLASEKLEDLSRWPTFDPNVYAASGTTVGSLTADDSASVSSGGIPAEVVNYYDDVAISDSNGAVAETVSLVSSGSPSYKTTTHNPDGTITSSTSPSEPAAAAGEITYHRRWTIEMDQPVGGIRRITVLVTLEGQLVQPPVSFQMTTVRP